ncbi:MAG: hypothetical protein JRG89_12310 [Deltaproteobacteria bacterium]|nr:hypothetical protein [Deltaproteobacteria bacterium]
MISGMLSIVVAWFILAGLLIGLGAAVSRVTLAAPRSGLSAPFWIGWAVWIAILQLLHMKIALGTPWVLALLAGLGCLGLWWNRSSLSETLRESLCERRLFLAGAAILGVWLCNRGLGPLLSIDAGLYHLGSIKWASEAPLIEGLGNLHGRLAFNSTAFLWMSSLDRWPSILRGFNVASGLLLMTAIVQVSHRVLVEPEAARNSPAATHFHSRIFHSILLLPLLYAAAVMHVSSTSPDWIVLILGVVLASELVALCSREADDEDEPSGHFLTIAALCAVGITVKLSFAPLGAMALAVAALRAAHPEVIRTDLPRTLGPGLLLALLLLVPWSLRSIELSGYPAYPTTFAGIDVAWKVPEERVEAEVRWIRSWARAPGKSPDEVLGNADWMLPWLANRLRASDSIALLVFPAVLVALGTLGAARRRSGASTTTATLLVPYAVAVLIWFVSAPDPRFLGSSLWVCAGAMLARATRHEASLDRTGSARRIANGASALCAIGFLVFIAYMGSTVAGAKGPFISAGPLHGRYPLRNVEMKSFQTDSGLILQVPLHGDRCWEAALPCTPYPAPRLRLRNEHAPFGGFELK